MHPEHSASETGMRSIHFPLMIEPLVFRPNTEGGGYMVDGDITKILPSGASGGRTGGGCDQGRSNG